MQLDKQSNAARNKDLLRIDVIFIQIHIKMFIKDFQGLWNRALLWLTKYTICSPFKQINHLDIKTLSLFTHPPGFPNNLLSSVEHKTIHFDKCC